MRQRQLLAKDGDVVDGGVQPRRAIAFEIPPPARAGPAAASIRMATACSMSGKPMASRSIRTAAAPNRRSSSTCPRWVPTLTSRTFSQIDWMADATHSHALSSAAIKKVVDAFAASPYEPNRVNRDQPARRRRAGKHPQLRHQHHLGHAKPRPGADTCKQPWERQLRLERLPSHQGRELHTHRPDAHLPL